MNEFQGKYGAGYAQENHPHKPHCHLQIIGFPCNQFGLQEPAKNHELLNALKYVRPGHGFVPRFPLSGKLEVNGKNEHSIFTFLKERCPPPQDIVSEHMHLTWSPIRANDIAWNFQKWLIGSDGHPYRRYSAPTHPKDMETDILRLLKECTISGKKTDTTTSETKKDSVGSSNDKKSVPKRKVMPEQSEVTTTSDPETTSAPKGVIPKRKDMTHKEVTTTTGTIGKDEKSKMGEKKSKEEDAEEWEYRPRKIS